jgi:hypothetical protein
MDWIFEHFQIVLLIGLAIGSMVKRHLDTKRVEQEEREAREEMANDEEVLIPGSEWPKPRLPALPSVLQQGPPGPPPGPVVLYQSAARPKRPPEQAQPARVIKATTTGGAVATRSRVSAAQSRAQDVKPVRSALLGALKTRKEVRRAILLREILGPPLGLR